MTGRAPSCLLELAERCEQATGEDAYLDLAIYKALDPDCIGSIATLTDAPAYTASLDAAMTLVPEGEDWAVGSGPLFPTSARVAGKPAVQAATSALALCAAALRARASTPTPPSDGDGK